MAGTLHIVKSAGTVHPWDVLAHQAASPESCAVLLVQDAVTAHPAVPCRVFALARDVRARGAQAEHPLVDDDRFLEMIWEADSVVVW